MDFFPSKSLLMKNFISSIKGAAAVEFLLALPILLVVFAILHDVSRMIIIKNNLTRAAANMADIISQGFKEEDLVVDIHVQANWKTMFQVLMFPDRRPIADLGYDVFMPAIFEVRTSGRDGQFLCTQTIRGALTSGAYFVTPWNNLSWTPGSRQPEVVVAAAYRFTLPLLSGPFGTKAAPSIILSSVERRFMRGVTASATGDPVINPMFGWSLINANCGPP